MSTFEKPKASNFPFLKSQGYQKEKLTIVINLYIRLLH
jgi:hypothetical protein